MTAQEELPKEMRKQAMMVFQLKSGELSITSKNMIPLERIEGGKTWKDYVKPDPETVISVADGEFDWLDLANMMNTAAEGGTI